MGAPMRVLLVQTYATAASQAAVVGLGHECGVWNYRHGPLVVKGEWPDVVALQQGDFKDRTSLNPDLVRMWQAHGARVVWWTYDPPVTKRPIYDELAKACDDQVVCTADDLQWYAGQGQVVRVDHVGIDPGVWSPEDVGWREQECYGAHADASVVGVLYPCRQRAIAALRAAGLEVAVWGRGLPGVQWLPVERVKLVYQSVPVNVVWPIEWGGGDAEYLICRHFEIPAVGGFMVARRSAAVVREFPMVPTFGDLGELVAQVRWWGKRPRERAAVAAAARVVVLERWTVSAFFERMLGRAPQSAIGDCRFAIGRGGWKSTSKSTSTRSGKIGAGGE